MFLYPEIYCKLIKNNETLNTTNNCFRATMSQGNITIPQQQIEETVTVATPEEFVHRFGGTRAINKVIVR